MYPLLLKACPCDNTSLYVFKIANAEWTVFSRKKRQAGLAFPIQTVVGLSKYKKRGKCMTLETLMLDFAQAVGGVSKQDGDVWVLEIPVDEERSRVVFFRLNSCPSGDGEREVLLAFFTRIGDYHGEKAVAKLEKMLRLAADLRYGRVALMDDDLVLLAVAPETFTEATMLEMVHEVVWIGERLSQELSEV